MKYFEVQILTTTEATDAIWYILDEEGAEGVTIEDPLDLANLRQDETRWDFIEDELIERMGTDVKVKGYFRSDNFSEEKSEQIKHRLGELRGFGLNPGKAEVIIGEIEDEDWANSWKRFYKPTKIGNRIVIKPSWEVYAPLGDEVIVELDPGMAFGTGTHETTSMCIMLIEKYLNGRKKVFDIGCGSGILGICAAKLGAEAVLCADFDEVACRVARENASINSVSETVDVRCGNLFDIVDRGEKAELIVANIIADVIIGLADEVEQFMAEDGIFISSGIIRERKDEVLHRFEEKKFKIIEVFELGEWCAIAATK